MALTSEGLSAISETMDKKLQPVHDALNTLKFSQEHIAEKLKGI